MNGKEIFLGLRYIGDDLIEEAEYAAYPKKQRSSGRRALLIAAVVALMLLLVGCAVVYMLRMQDMQVGQQQSYYDKYDYDTMEYLGTEPYTEQVYTIAGLQGSNAYKAAREWFDFRQVYDPDMKILSSVWGNEPEFPGEYDSYNLYSQEMKDKLDEIARKYNLKLAGQELPFRTLRNLCQALDIARIHTAQNDLTVTIESGSCLENGNFYLHLNVRFPEEADSEMENIYCYLSWSRKDCFTDDFIIFEDTGDWREWSYTTSSGTPVVITRSESKWLGYILCDRGDAVMALEVENNRSIGSDPTDTMLMLTDGQLEQIADAVDFGIQPRVATWEDVQNQPEAPDSATQNGYTLRLKSVETDGLFVRILVGITAPEGTIISYNPHEGFVNKQYHIGANNMDTLTPVSGSEVSFNGAWNAQSDGDGLSNTQDILLERHIEMEDGSDLFVRGSVWNIRLEDLTAGYYNSEKGEFITDQLAEGEWNFTVTFDDHNGDYRVLEFAPEPIAMEAMVGWKADGTDVYDEVEVTSFQLRSLSAAIYHNEGFAADFSTWDKPLLAVMKDGSTVLLQPTGGSPGTTWYVLEQRIDLDNVDHIRLMDGTKLIAS